MADQQLDTGTTPGIQIPSEKSSKAKKLRPKFNMLLVDLRVLKPGTYRQGSAWKETDSVFRTVLLFLGYMLQDTQAVPMTRYWDITRKRQTVVRLQL